MNVTRIQSALVGLAGGVASAALYYNKNPKTVEKEVIKTVTVETIKEVEVEIKIEVAPVLSTVPSKHGFNFDESQLPSTSRPGGGFVPFGAEALGGVILMYDPLYTVEGHDKPLSWFEIKSTQMENIAPGYHRSLSHASRAEHADFDTWVFNDGASKSSSDMQPGVSCRYDGYFKDGVFYAVKRSEWLSDAPFLDRYGEHSVYYEIGYAHGTKDQELKVFEPAWDADDKRVVMKSRIIPLESITTNIPSTFKLANIKWNTIMGFRYKDMVVFNLIEASSVPAEMYKPKGVSVSDYIFETSDPSLEIPDDEDDAGDLLREALSGLRGEYPETLGN